MTINTIDEHGNVAETWCIGGAKPDYGAVGVLQSRPALVSWREDPAVLSSTVRRRQRMATDNSE